MLAQLPKHVAAYKLKVGKMLDHNLKFAQHLNEKGWYNIVQQA